MTSDEMEQLAIEIDRIAHTNVPEGVTVSFHNEGKVVLWVACVDWAWLVRIADVLRFAAKTIRKQSEMLERKEESR